MKATLFTLLLSAQSFGVVVDTEFQQKAVMKATLFTLQFYGIEFL